MALKLYCDFMSPPARACYILLKYANIPFESCLIDLKRQQHLSDEYKKINYFQKVPAMDDKGFKLSESISIMKYAIEKYGTEQNIIPKDIQIKAKVEEFLHWYHLNLRYHFGMYFRIMVLKPLLTGKPPEMENINKYDEMMKEDLKALDDYFLVKPNNFIGGSSSLGIADILAVCELSQYDYLYSSLLDLIGKSNGSSKVVWNWYNAVKDLTQPHFDFVHKIPTLVKKKIDENRLKSKL